MKKPENLQEQRAINFAIDLITKYGYSFTIKIPSRDLAADLTRRGKRISFMTVIAYWKALERMGYVERKMSARIWGVKYTLNRYAISKLINSAQ